MTISDERWRCSAVAMQPAVVIVALVVGSFVADVRYLEMRSHQRLRLTVENWPSH